MKMNSYYIKNHVAPILLGIVIGALIVGGIWFIADVLIPDAYSRAITSE